MYDKEMNYFFFFSLETYKHAYIFAERIFSAKNNIMRKPRM